MRLNYRALPLSRLLFLMLLLVAAVLAVTLSQNAAATPTDPFIVPDDLEATLERPGQSISQVTGRRWPCSASTIRSRPQPPKRWPANTSVPMPPNST